MVNFGFPISKQTLTKLIWLVCFWLWRFEDSVTLPVSHLALTEGEVRVGRSSLHAEDYHLAPVDLARLEEVRTALTECSLRPDRPTIVLAECVLVYMEPRACHQLLAHLAGTLSTAYFVNYEMVSSGKVNGSA